MEFNGVIKNVDRIVVSDPSFGEDVWCRYEKTDVKGRDWKVHGFISDYSQDFDGLYLKGVKFVVGLAAPDEHFELHEDGSFAHYTRVKVKEVEIGMDTACVGIGINGVADEIKARRDEWQPDCCLKTLTDGLFGTVNEGCLNGDLRFLVISGYLDEDTGYSKEDVLGYLVTAMNIELDKTLGLDEIISDAKNKSLVNELNNKGFEKNDIDLG